MYSKDRKEWLTLLEPSNKFDFSFYPLQMKLTKLKSNVSAGKMTKEDAVEEIIEMCGKYKRAVKGDLERMFNNKSV